MRIEILEIFRDSVRECMKDPNFDEPDLIKIIANNDFNHQLYLLAVLINFYFKVEPDGLAVRYAHWALYKAHLDIQKILDADTKEDSDVTKDLYNSYIEYLDCGLRFSHNFTEKDQDRFRAKCERRHNTRRRAS